MGKLALLALVALAVPSLVKTQNLFPDGFPLLSIEDILANIPTNVVPTNAPACAAWFISQTLTMCGWQDQVDTVPCPDKAPNIVKLAFGDAFRPLCGGLLPLIPCGLLRAPGAARCYIQPAPKKKNTWGTFPPNPSKRSLLRPGQQCCYDLTGDLLVDPGRAGPSMQFMASFNPLGFGVFDYIPYTWCCTAAENGPFCRLYFAVRPASKGSLSLPAALLKGWQFPIRVCDLYDEFLPSPEDVINLIPNNYVLPDATKAAVDVIKSIPGL